MCVLTDAVYYVDVALTGIMFSLQTSCMSHFYIDLRQAASPETMPSGHSQIHVSLSRFVGTLEGSLVFGSDGYVGEDEVNDSSLCSNDNWGVKSVGGIAMENMANSRFSPDLNASLALKQKHLGADAKAV